MTITRRILWLAISAAALLLPLAIGAGVARANGIGDLYVGAGPKVVEVHLAGQAIVNTVAIPSAATSLAFSPDGRRLYAAIGTPSVAVIDIGTISAAPPLTAAGPVVAVAHPSGDRLAVAIPDLARVALVNPGDGRAADIGMTGPVDLLAADRRVPIVLAAATTGGWVSIIDSALGTSRTVPIEGRVVGMAVDRDTGGAYVATRSPDAVLRLELGTAKVAWRITLDGRPTSVAATADGAVVAIGARLVAATAKGSTAFTTLPGAAVAVAGSDDGKILVAAMADRVQGYASSGGPVRSQVMLAKGNPATAIAPVPKPIVLDETAGSATAASPATGGTSGAAASGGTVKGGAAAHPTHPPATATDLGTPGKPAEPPILGAAAVAGLILAAWWGTHLVLERRRREARRRARVVARRSGRPLGRGPRPSPGSR